MSRNNRFNKSNVPVRVIDNFPLMPAEFIISSEDVEIYVIKTSKDSGINLYLNTPHVFPSMEAFVEFVGFHMLLIDGLSVTFYPGCCVEIPDKSSSHGVCVSLFQKYFKFRGLKVRIDMNFERGFLSFNFDRSVIFNQYSLHNYLLQKLEAETLPIDEEYEERLVNEFGEDADEFVEDADEFVEDADEFGKDADEFGKLIMDGPNCLMNDFYCTSRRLIDACVYFQLLPIGAGEKNIIFPNSTTELINESCLREELCSKYGHSEFGLTLEPLSSDSQLGFKLSIIVF